MLLVVVNNLFYTGLCKSPFYTHSVRKLTFHVSVFSASFVCLHIFYNTCVITLRCLIERRGLNCWGDGGGVGVEHFLKCNKRGKGIYLTRGVAEFFKNLKNTIENMTEEYMCF